MRLNLRNRIMLTFVLVIVALAVVSGALGIIFIDRYTVAEEQRRVGVDLKSAWSVVDSRFDELATLVNVLSTGKRVSDAYRDPASETSRVSLEAVRMQFKLDFLGLTDAQGRVILRTQPPYRTHDLLVNDPLIAQALKGENRTGFQILPAGRLAAEGGDLEERAFIVFETTPKAKPRARETESAGLVMMAASAVTDATGEVQGVLYAGTLLSRNHALVDQIRSVVFEDQSLNGRPVGTVTIFQWDVRVATNVVLPGGNRALGTRVSAEVYDRVLENSQGWYSRAFVVDDWYISAYDPIRDVDDKVVGILYVGVLARKFDEIRSNLWTIYGGFSAAGAILVVLAGTVFAGRLTRTVGRLAEGTVRIAGGELDLRLREPKADDELRDLTRAFNSMASSLKERDEKLGAARTELETTNTKLQRINQNYLDMLEFVSHELKNTLGVIFTSAKTLHQGLTGPLNANQEQLVNGIVRNIDSAVSMTRNYLDLARIEKGELKLTYQEVDLSTDVIPPVLEELQAVLERRDLRLQLRLPLHLPLRGDPDLLRVVIKNLLDNAVKYGREGGMAQISGRIEANRVWLDIYNEGDGLPPEQLGRLFQRFVRFRSNQESDRLGTGLGLFITRDIVERHGGTIAAESEAGRFIVFHISLPTSEKVTTDA